MIDAITGSLTALRGTADLARSAIDARDAGKLSELRAVLNERIIDVQNAVMALQATNSSLLQDKHTLAEEKRGLERQIRELLDSKAQLDAYERFRTPAGALVYRHKTSSALAEGPVYACAACMDRGEITTLQPTQGGGLLTCHVHGAFGDSVQAFPSGGIGMLTR